MKTTRNKTRSLLAKRQPDPGRKLVYDALNIIIDKHKSKNGGMCAYGYYRDILEKYGSQHSFLNLKSIGKNYLRHLKKKPVIPKIEESNGKFYNYEALLAVAPNVTLKGSHRYSFYF